MNINDQVCTQEQSKQLAALGITTKPLMLRVVKTNFSVPYSTSLYSVAELAVMVGNAAPSWSFEYEGKTRWIATIITDGSDINNLKTSVECDRFGDTQAEALAELLISGLRTGLFNADEVNNRLIGL